MTTREAYEYQLNRLTAEEKIQVNVREANCGRNLAPWEIFTIFKLQPSGEMKPRKRRTSDEMDEEKRWMD